MDKKNDSQLYDDPVVQGDLAEIAAAMRGASDALAGRTVLITGAYGMLAAYIVYALLYMNDHEGFAKERPIKVVALGRSKQRMRDRFGALLDREDLEAVYDDCLHYAEALVLGTAVPRPGLPDLVIHAASPTDPRSYLTDPEKVIEANVTATAAWLKAAEAAGTEGFLYISSGEVYGRIVKDVIREEDGGVIDSADPRSVYAMSKRLGERLCVEAAKKKGLKAVIVRPSHTYGPTMNLESDSRVFASFVSDAVNGKDIVIKSDGLATRAFTYLTDAVTGYLTALLKGGAGEAYNVTNNSGIRSIREIASRICEVTGDLTGVERSAVFGEPDMNYIENANRKASVRSTEKLEALGWKAEVSPEEGFARTLRSILA